MSAPRAAARRTADAGQGTYRWHLGFSSRVAAGDGVVAFTAAEALRARAVGAETVLFHEAMTFPFERAAEVEVNVPPYRGKSLIPALAWLACRMAAPGARVSWWLDKRQGPGSVHRLLEDLGWRLDKDRKAGRVRLCGCPPSTVTEPDPERFVADLGSKRVELQADFGVFSPGRIDEGTALLLQVALRHPHIDVVTDIGVGYGPLAIGLVVNGVAGSAVGTDVDGIALWLAERNAHATGVPLDLACTPAPSEVPPTGLTVCNVPTHLGARESGPFLAELAARAEHGTLVIVVHASLEKRYARHLAANSRRVMRHRGASHVVLETEAS